MKKKNLIEEYRKVPAAERTLLQLLALYGDAVGKTRLVEMLRDLKVRQPDGKAHTASTLTEMLGGLRRHDLVIDLQGSGFSIPEQLRLPVLHSAIEDKSFDRLCEVIEAFMPVERSYDGQIYLRSYPQGLARLRLALLRGLPPKEVYPWLEACAVNIDARKVHPYVRVCGQPFEPDLFERLHPVLQEEAMVFLLEHALSNPESARPLRTWVQARIGQGEIGSSLACAVAEHQIWCGALEQAWELVATHGNALAQYHRATIHLLRGELEKARAGFDAALKALRKETSRRNAFFGGTAGLWQLLLMMRTSDPHYRKQADALHTAVLRNGPDKDTSLYIMLLLLRDVRAGLEQPERAWTFEGLLGEGMLPQLLQGLLYYWLGLARLEAYQPVLKNLFKRADETGFDFIAAQAADLLYRSGDSSYKKHAAALRNKYGFDSMCDWFERQEPWQLKLTALLDV
ncbi:MAG TPA: ATP-dependent helicase, partial [Noviherbaspirillum sp.]